MRVSEAMSLDVFVAHPDHTILEAARAMCDIDVGALPVAENDRLVGIITDRDIAVRAGAENRGPSTPGRQVMTQDVKFCYDDEDADHVARDRGVKQIRRLPRLNRGRP